MDGMAPDGLYLEERRRRLAAERTLEHTRRELARAHSALVANADRLSRRYLSEREQNLKLTARQEAVLAARKDAADKADRARRRLWHALQAMRDGFAVFDTGGRLIAANQVYLDLFDGSGEVGPGCHATEIFSLAAEEGAFDIGDLTPEEWADEQVARWDTEMTEPLILQHYDGRVLQFQDRRAPDGDVVSLALDVTDQRARETSLAQAVETAEQTARVKADFLTRMSHEIRTPMNGVIGLSELLVEQAKDEEAAMYARTIRDSAQALLVIVNDTLDVSQLEAGKMALRKASMDLEALLIDCIRLAAGTAKAGVDVGLAYPIGARTQFVGDAGRIRQIVMNLLGNALKFTERGHVAIRVTLGAVAGGVVPLSITVEDTGPGIPQAQATAVFEAFEQVHDASRPASEGTGLGLTISRGLAERMGGTLTLDSRPEEGSTFTLHLPLEPEGATPDRPVLPRTVTVPGGIGFRADVMAARLKQAGATVRRDLAPSDGLILLPLGGPAEGQAALLPNIGTDARLILLGLRADAHPDLAARADAILPEPIAGHDLVAAFASPVAPVETPLATLPSPRLLLADDNATNRLLLDRMLRDQPYTTEMVVDGETAFAAYQRQRPDAVVLDISMPGMDGFDTARAIQTLEAGRGNAPAPIIALTAHVGKDMAERLTQAGFVAHLTKPLSKPVLLAALTTALSSA